MNIYNGSGKIILGDDEKSGMSVTPHHNTLKGLDFLTGSGLPQNLPGLGVEAAGNQGHACKGKQNQGVVRKSCGFSRDKHDQGPTRR